MDKNIYGFIFYLLFFTLYESSAKFMFSRIPAETKFDQYKESPKSQELHFGDLVFNEVMADPYPVIKLPNEEYIELTNVSGLDINLENWVLDVNGRQKILKDHQIKADSLIILCGTGGNSLFAGYGPSLEIPGLSLPNAGFVVKLYSPLKILIDSLSYEPGMLREGFSDGGYSLERIDPHRICGAGSNWETSISESGGTPGSENSVFASNRDNSPPSIISANGISPELLEIVVSEMPDRLSISGSVFSFSPSLPPFDSIRFEQKSKKYSIYFPKGGMKNGVYYDLLISRLSDECGNVMVDRHYQFWYYLPKPGDLLINEILFNPFEGGVDFVEIFNQSGHTINLDELFLASLDATQKIKSLYPLSVSRELFSNSQYGAFTADPATLLSNYNSKCPDCIYGMIKFPPYNLDEGWVVLVNKELSVIDQFHYFESMHNPLLSDVKGISLERRSFIKPTQDPFNWCSAAATVGFATPGYRNSAVELLVRKKPNVQIEPKIFSPNDDGLNDKLVIKLFQDEPGRIANIRIYNESGIEIRRLANNLLLGSEDIIEWDGTRDNHQKALLGIYIIQVEIFGLNSGSDHFKGACVLTDRLE